jgi:hypothetical protein
VLSVGASDVPKPPEVLAALALGHVRRIGHEDVKWPPQRRPQIAGSKIADENSVVTLHFG